MSAFSYVNRRGNRYYLHAARTVTGKLRYFVAKTAGEGALAAMPVGYELTESINGVVSVRRIDRHVPQVAQRDVELVRAEVARHDHLRNHRAECVRGEIVVFEPSSVLDLETEPFARVFGRIRRAPDRLAASTRYAPVLKFVPCGASGYTLHRMNYRGRGGWSWALAHGPLAELMTRVGTIGTDAFFDMM